MKTYRSLSQIRGNSYPALPVHRPSNLGRNSVAPLLTDYSNLPEPPAGYVWVYETDGLSGLGKFKLKKLFKAIVSPITAVVKVAEKVAEKVVKSKTFKKLAPVALVGAGLYFSAPWFVKLAKGIGTVAAKALVSGRAPDTEISTEQGEMETSSENFPSWIASAAEQALIAKQQQRQAEEAQYAAAVRANQEAIQRQREEQEMRRQYEIQQQQYPQQPQQSQLPTWLIPAAIGGAALLLTLKS